MDDALTVRGLFDELKDRLEFKWVAGREGGGSTLRLTRRDHGKQPASPVGYLNFFRINQIQVLGKVELDYVNGLVGQSQDDFLKQLFAAAPSCIIVADGLNSPRALQQQADLNDTPLWGSSLMGEALVDYLRYFFANRGAEHATLHGVFMEVLGIGVLLAGPSGVGKSELALELITRGHRLIADDAPDFARVAPDTITGACPKTLQDFLEVRGLGILDVRAMFGDSAIKQHESLRLIVKLNRMKDSEIALIDRQKSIMETRKVLDVAIPQITLPVIMGSNLAVLVEGAVRNHLLYQKGYNASESFISRQRRYIGQSEI